MAMYLPYKSLQTRAVIGQSRYGTGWAVFRVIGSVAHLGVGGRLVNLLSPAATEKTIVGQGGSGHGMVTLF